MAYIYSKEVSNWFASDGNFFYDICLLFTDTFVCLISFFMSYQQSFSYIGMCLPGLNQD